MSEDMRAHSYPWEYKSAIAKAKRVLQAAGVPWSSVTGRYAPYGSTKHWTHGVRVSRIGCSETIALHTYPHSQPRDETRALKEQALTALRAAGMPFDDRGWLACGADTRRAFERYGR